MDLRGDIRSEMQQARNDVTVKQPLGEQQARLGKNIEKARDQEVRQALESFCWIRRIRSTRSLGSSCAGSGAGFMGVFLTSSGERKPPLTWIIRTTVSHAVAAALRIITLAAIT